MKLVRPIVKTTRTVQGTVRDLNRLREVSTILIRHGFGALFAGVDIPGIPKPSSFRSTPPRFESTSARVVHALQELGPTFIKMGQILSSRTDVLPPDYLEAFQILQDNVANVPFSTLAPVVEASLGPGWEDIMQVDPNPVAAGSVAQVHRAKLLQTQDGAITDVAVKIIRPGVKAKLTADLSILRFLANRLIAEFPESASFDPVGLVDELVYAMRNETDLRVEALHAKVFHQNLSSLKSIRVPVVVEELSGEQMIVMEFMKGVRIRDCHAHGHDMEKLGTLYLDAAYKMIFDDGFFHGDLHPGNVLVTDTSELVILDLGMAGRLTKEMKDDLVALLFALERGDLRTVSRIYFELAVKQKPVAFEVFERDVTSVMERHWIGKSTKDLRIGEFLKDLADGAMRHGVRAPTDFTMFFKAILTSEGLARSLVPEVDLVAAAQPYVERLIRERFGKERFHEDLFYNLITTRTFLRRLGQVTSTLLDDLDQGRAKWNVVVESSPLDRRIADRRTTRWIVFGISVTALLAGSLVADMELPGFLGLAWPAWVLYTSASITWAWSLWLTLKGSPNA